MPVPEMRALDFGRRLNIVATYYQTEKRTVSVPLPTVSETRNLGGSPDALT